MENFIIGVIAMASWIAGLFFLRFWRETRDRLFLIFAIAFWLLGLTRFALVLYSSEAQAAAQAQAAQAPVVVVQPEEAAAEADEITKESEQYFSVYWVRLAAFVLILLAIIDKNLAQHDKSPPGT